MLKSLSAVVLEMWCVMRPVARSDVCHFELPQPAGVKPLPPSSHLCRLVIPGTEP